MPYIFPIPEIPFLDYETSKLDEETEILSPSLKIISSWVVLVKPSHFETLFLYLYHEMLFQASLQGTDVYILVLLAGKQVLDLTRFS